MPAQQRLGEEWYRGTADAIWQNVYLLDQLKPRPRYVLVLSGDHVYQMDYTGLLAYHAAAGGAVTVCAQERPVEGASEFGVITVDDAFRIRALPGEARTARHDPRESRPAYWPRWGSTCSTPTS